MLSKNLSKRFGKMDYLFAINGRQTFFYSQPIIFAHVRCRKVATGGYIVSPPNTVCVTTLPCKILITTSRMLDFAR